MIDLLFEASIADVLDDHISDERLKTALFGQGIIGTWGGPRDPGTASIKLMHFQGDMDGRGPALGLRRGRDGDGELCDRRRRARGRARCSPAASRWPRSSPGEGVTLEDGTSIRASTVISNADPKRTLGMLDGQEVDAGFRERLERWKVRSPVVKFNAALDRLPNWAAAPGEDVARPGHHRRHRARWTTPSAPSRPASAASRRSHSARSTSRPDTTHRPRRRASTCLASSGSTRPTSSRTGDWDARRDEVARQFIDLIDRFAPGFEDCLVDHEVLGPPDIESRIGLTGGNIFQGEVTPDQMWEGRLRRAHPGARPLPVRGRHPSRRQRDRPERSQRGRGGARRRRRRAGGRLARQPSMAATSRRRRAPASGSSRPPAT